MVSCYTSGWGHFPKTPFGRSTIKCHTDIKTSSGGSAARIKAEAWFGQFSNIVCLDRIYVASYYLFQSCDILDINHS